jgi:MoaA/NifB/PqqE/SkfB family radical SAM enzyme
MPPPEAIEAAPPFELHSLTPATGLVERLRAEYRRFDTMAPGLKPLKAYGNWLRANRDMARQSTKLRAKPLKLTFDPTNVCQLKCPLCPTGLELSERSASRAELAMFEGLMDEVGDSLFMLDLFNWGEPLLNGKLTEFLRIAHRKRVSTTVSTNLSMRLSDERLRDIIGSGLNHLIVSLDGASESTAGTYRRGGDFNLVVENMRRLVELRREMNSSTPYIIWRFLVFRFNEHELSRAARLATEIGVDRFTVAPAFLDEGTYDIPQEDREAMRTWVPTDPRLSYYDTAEDAPAELHKLGEPGQVRGRCDWHYMSAAINADGGVAPCCALFHDTDDFGSLAASGHGSYMDLVNNENFTAVRDLYAGRRSEPSATPCDNCPAPNIMNYSETLNRWVLYITVMSVLRLFLAPLRPLLGRGPRRYPQTVIEAPVDIPSTDPDVPATLIASSRG